MSNVRSMCSALEIILLAFVVQAHAKELYGNRAVAKEFVDRLVAKLVDKFVTIFINRALKERPLHHIDLNNTTLADLPSNRSTKRDGKGGGGGQKMKKKGKASEIQVQESSVPLNSQGFLITTRGSSKDQSMQAGFEAQRLLEDQLEKFNSSTKNHHEEDHIEDDKQEAAVTVADALQAELEELRETSKNNYQKKPFRWTKISDNYLWVANSPNNPSSVDLAAGIFKELDENRQPISRFIARMVPILDVCSSSVEEITQRMEPLINRVFPKPEELGDSKGIPFRCCVSVKCHSGLKNRKMEIIDALAAKVPEINKVNLTRPDAVILVQVIRKTAMLTVLRNYTKYEEYNIEKLGKTKETLEALRAAARSKTHQNEVRRKFDQQKLASEPTSEMEQEKLEEETSINCA